MRWVHYVCVEPVWLADMSRVRSADSSAQQDGGNVGASHYTKLWKTHLQPQGGLNTASKLATFDLYSVLLLQRNECVVWSLAFPLILSLLMVRCCQFKWFWPFLKHILLLKEKNNIWHHEKLKNVNTPHVQNILMHSRFICYFIIVPQCSCVSFNKSSRWNCLDVW